MGLVIFKRYNNIGDALIAFSALESGGFHPNWHNYYHGHNTLMEVIALGGNIIQIPMQEYQDAHLHIANLRSQAISDFDPLPSTHVRNLKRSLLFLSTWALLIVPFAFLAQMPYKIALGIAAAILLGLGFLLGFTSGAYLLSLILFGLSAVGFLVFAAALTYPIWTTLILITMNIGSGLVLGINASNLLGILILFLYLLLNLHAKYIAVPKLEKGE